MQLREAHANKQTNATIKQTMLLKLLENVTMYMGRKALCKCIYTGLYAPLQLYMQSMNTARIKQEQNKNRARTEQEQSKNRVRTERKRSKNGARTKQE